ncbi:MAG TPA: phosphatase PAP2 family protein [Vicinamibacteria bacterium]|nr:phosphatase PAP2 family protein [Vicinamibacteria bacterium]
MKRFAGTAAVASTLVFAWGSLPCWAQTVEPLAGPVPPKVLEAKPLSWDGFGGDGRRTMSAFPKNLGRNFVGVFSTQNLLPFAVGAAATGAASAFDHKTQDALMGACQACGHTGAKVGGAMMVPVVTTLFVAGRFSPQGRFRAATYDFAQALIVNGAYSGLLKHTVHRPRPDGSDNLSFPSGHASTAFSLATVANHHYGWKVGVPAYALASCIGLTRIESNRHNLSDVLAGATLGIIVGRTVGRLDGDRPAKKRSISVGPATDARGQGVGLGLSASW